MTQLSVSNLAWNPALHKRAVELLASLGVQGVEVAPTRIGDWPELDAKRLRGYRARIEAAGLRISSLQAIYYNVPDAQLLGDAAGFARMLEHTRKVGDVAAELGVKVAVFGAPKNRTRGVLSETQALDRAAERLPRLGDVAREFGFAIGIEPLPMAYGADFLNTSTQVTALLERMNHPAVRLHLDTGCALLAGESIGQAIRQGRDWLVHFHVSEPQLAGFDAPRSDHPGAAKALSQVGYTSWIAIEMRETEGRLGALENSVRFIQTIFSI